MSARLQRIGFCIATTGYSDAERERRRQQMLLQLPPGFDLDVVVVPNGPEFLDARADFGRAVEAASAFLADPAIRAYDVLVSAGAIDPGLARFRSISPVPVVGPGEAAMFLGHVLGRPLSIVTVDEHAVVASHELLEETTTKPEIASVRSMDLPVRQIVQDLDRGRNRLVAEATQAVREDGAGTLYLGAMTLGTLGVDRQLQDELGVFVINPIRVALATAVQCLRT